LGLKIDEKEQSRISVWIESEDMIVNQKALFWIPSLKWGSKDVSAGQRYKY
jgi:hypothetical protein